MITGGRYRAKKEAVIAALLSEPTQDAAAVKSGVSRDSITRWLRDADFRREYEAARHELVDQSVLKLQQASSEAIDTLVEVMKNADCPASARVSAANSILDRAQKSIEDWSKRQPKKEESPDLEDLPLTPDGALILLAQQINMAMAKKAGNE